MTLSPGDRIDRYEIQALLGAGGMGEVYRARDPKLARLVALKVLHVGGPGTDGPARLLREARAAGALAHPNVLAIYDIGEVEEPASLRGLSYIAMELVVGRTLRACVGDTSIPLERKVDWLRKVASALGAAHAAGIVHRDVKPENVMIRDDGTVKVLDFGIARRTVATEPASGDADTLAAAFATSGHATMGGFVGTPQFMAPEQLRGEATIDGRADQFAWGVTAYLLLTGKSPWMGAVEPLAVISQILSKDPPTPGALDPAIPRSASDTIVRALSKAPSARYASMEELLAALDGRHVEPARAASTVPEPPAHAPRGDIASPRRRGRRRVVISAAAVTLAAAVATLLLARGRAKTNTPSPSLATADEPCTSNEGCVRAHGGAPWHCHSKRHACVPLESVDCKVHAEPNDTASSDVVWLGGMYPLSTVPGLDGEMRAAELARQDFALALAPSATRTGHLRARRIGFVVCDEGVDAMRAARHLVDDVEAPAVLGFFGAETAMKTIAGELLPNHVLSFVTVSQAPAITRIPEPPGEPRLVWRSTLDRNDFVPPLVAFVEQVLEPAARARKGKGRRGGSSRPFRVAAVWAKAANHELIDLTFSTLHFNGKSALENGSDFRQFVYETDNGSAVAPDVIGELATFAPDVVFFANVNFLSKVLTPLEERWGHEPRPVYLTVSGLSQKVGAFVGHDAGRRRRFFASNNVATSMPNAQLVLRYNLAFPEDPVVYAEAPQPSYDAFYTLAYAALALGDQEITGPALSGAIGRLVPPASRTIDVGPKAILDGFAGLRSPEGRIDLNGALGPLDFDPSTGEAPIGYAIDCLGVDDQGSATRSVDSGLVYDPTTGLLRGHMDCP